MSVLLLADDKDARLIGVRIGGLTGIFNRRHYHLGHYENPPYSPDDMRSAYHIRELEVSYQ